MNKEIRLKLWPITSTCRRFEYYCTNEPDSALTEIQAEEHRDTQAAPGNESQQLTVSAGTKMSVSEDQLIAPSTVTPRTFERKLEEAHLPPTKRVGRPRKAKALQSGSINGT
jgi:hypothetical protein